MLLSVGLTVYFIANALPSVAETGIVKQVADGPYGKVFFFDDLYDSNQFLKHFFGGIFIAIGMTGLDQDMMQKNLSCKNLKSAQLNMVSFAGILVVVNLIFLSLGALLYMYYEQTTIGSNALENLSRTDLLFAEIANNGSLGFSVGVLFLLGLVAAAYSSADSALTSLTTSFSIDFMSIEKKSKNKQLQIRKWVHVCMSLVLVFVIILLRKYSDDSAIWLLIKLAGFTYGPLIALFFFGIITKRQIKDSYVPWVCTVVPIVLGLIWYLDDTGFIEWFGNYQFGAELIIYNTMLSFIGLFCISTKTKS